MQVSLLKLLHKMSEADKCKSEWSDDRLVIRLMSTLERRGDGLSCAVMEDVSGVAQPM
jgi:hypothetical protein